MQKKYRIIKSDLCIAGKIYPEGSLVEFYDESLSNFFEPIPEDSSNIDPPTLSFQPANWRGEILSSDVSKKPSTDSLNNSKLSFRPEGEISFGITPLDTELPPNEIIQITNEPNAGSIVKSSPKKGRPKKSTGEI
ncbi:MAG: hypothetical protein ACYCVH_15375 [Ignavibacteriaceae bacterium]